MGQRPLQNPPGSPWGEEKDKDRHLVLAEKRAEREGSYYDLESPRDLARLAQPQTALETARGLVVLDEIHSWRRMSREASSACRWRN